MPTIFERWVSAKTALAAQCSRILECAHEADRIIIANCGQTPSTVFRKEGLIISFWVSSPMVEILAESYYVHLERAFPEKHLPVPLKAAEAALEIAKGITTGTLIEIWEETQA